MTLVPESTKSYSIFLEIIIDTLNKSLERQRNVNSLWITADTNIWLLFFLVATWIFEEFPGNLSYFRVLFSSCSRNAWNFCLSSAIIWNKVNSEKFEKAKIMKLQLDVTTRVSNEQYGTGFLDIIVWMILWVRNFPVKSPQRPTPSY